MILHGPSGATGVIQSLKQATTKVLVDKVPYYQYNNNQIYGAQTRKEIPARPHLSGTSGPGEMNDQMWGLLTRCWHYTPKSRPSCKALQDSITGMKIGDRPSTITTEAETRSAFWEAMREGHDDGIDYARIEEILLRVSFRTFYYNSRICHNKQFTILPTDPVVIKSLCRESGGTDGS